MGPVRGEGEAAAAKKKKKRKKKKKKALELSGEKRGVPSLVSGGEFHPKEKGGGINPVPRGFLEGSRKPEGGEEKKKPA